MRRVVLDREGGGFVAVDPTERGAMLVLIDGISPPLLRGPRRKRAERMRRALALNAEILAYELVCIGIVLLTSKLLE